MSGRTIKVTAGAHTIKAFNCGIATSAADVIPGAKVDESGDQMAAFISRVPLDGEPLIVIGLVHGGEQKTLALTPAQADLFCGALADAVLWQNEELRQKAGQRVH